MYSINDKDNGNRKRKSKSKSVLGKSVYLDDFFSEYGEDSNGNGKVLVNVYYIPYGEDEYQNYINGVTNKLTNYLTNNEAVMIIGDKRTTEDLLTPDENFVDLSRLYPDNPHVKDYFFYTTIPVFLHP